MQTGVPFWINRPLTTVYRRLHLGIFRLIEHWYFLNPRAGLANKLNVMPIFFRYSLMLLAFRLLFQRICLATALSKLNKIQTMTNFFIRVDLLRHVDDEPVSINSDLNWVWQRSAISCSSSFRTQVSRISMRSLFAEETLQNVCNWFPSPYDYDITKKSCFPMLYLISGF